MSIVDPTPDEVIPERSIFDRSTEGIAAVGIVIAIALGVAIAMWETTRTLLAEWSNTENLTYTHGWLIAAVSAWCILRTRITLSRLPFSPQLPVAGLLFGVSVLWLIVYQAGLLVVHQALLPIAMWLAVFAICGWAVARECAFGFAYLYFAIPVWSLLNSMLQSATTVAMKTSLPLVGVPTYFDGNTVHIPSGVFEIAGGCSGLHFFIVGVAIAALYGEIHRDRLKTRVLLVVAVAVLSILANWIRVFTIIVAGHLTEMQHFLITVDHYYFGWAVFAVSMALFFYWASRMPQSEHIEAHEQAQSKASSRGHIWLAAVLSALAVAVGPLRAAQARANLSTIVAVLPQLSGEWSGPHPMTGEWQPKFVRADAAAQGVYRAFEREVEVFVAHYADQRQGKELNSSGNSVLGETMSARGPRKRISNEFGEREMEASNGTRWIVWDRYQVGARGFYSPTMGQLWYGAASVRTVLPSAVLALRSQCVPDCEVARKTNEQFVRDSLITTRLIQ
jgi:exosortase A